jgi:hypothetical protein
MVISWEKICKTHQGRKAMPLCTFKCEYIAHSKITTVQSVQVNGNILNLLLEVVIEQ